MRCLFVFCLLFFVVASARADLVLPANVEHVETFRGVDQYRLKSNGMTILLLPNHASPVFTFMVVYHVGSRNEAPGNTGSAHLLEHMIFNKSTENFGRAKGHKTFQEVLFAAGADYSSTNMTTWFDRMNGYSTLPSDKLELAMKIEADRLGRALILDSERQPEMSVVRNEYEIGENNPEAVLYKAVVSTAIREHPYHWDTIGYRSDIEGVSTEKLREHYRTFFHPNNSEAILVGDFNLAQALALFDREFGSLKRSDQPIPQVITVEPPQEGERRVTVQRPGTVGLVELGYVRPGALHADFSAFEVLAAILGSGVNSRLYQALVETQLATAVSADNYTLRDPFPLLITATVAPDRSHAEIEQALKAALAKVAAEGVTAGEVQRAQNQIEVSVVRSRDGAYALASSLGEAVASADWKWFLTYVDRIKAVTPADIERVAATYLVPDHATVGWFVPKAKSATPAPAAAVTAVKPPATALKPVGAPVAAPAPMKNVTSSSFAARATRKVLANGIVLDVIEDHANPTVAIRGLVFAGDSTEPAARRALPGLVARLLERGTAKRSKEQLGALLDDVGATRSYSAALTESSLQLNGLSRDLPLLLDVLGEEIAEPAFSPDELAKAKAEAKTAYLQLEDSTAFRAVQRLGQLTLPTAHPYRTPTNDALLASLEAITLDQVKAYHKDRYVGASVILAVVGDVDAAQVITLAEKSLGRLAAGTRPRPAADRVVPAGPATREVITMRGKANMNIIIGGASGLRRSDPDYEAALIGNAAFGQSSLSSRLGKRVRDTEGLSYNLASRYYYTDALDGLWLANINVAPQNLAKALHSSLDEIAKYAREGVTEEEVEVQKNFFAGNFQVGLGTNSGLAAALVAAEKFGFGPAYLDDYPRRFRAVTREQVNAALTKHFLPDRFHVVVAGDLEKLPE